MPQIYDEGESYSSGDPSPDEIDWQGVAEIERRRAEALALPEGAERNMAMLSLLDEMYGEELVLR